ncbi:hypothetical protein H257_02135 [Aphanomyces astaci]|uniref:RNB domain-containing protein n=1 Tax=Aphanomyces astaci TaxID=112090 RepID=W4H5H7_APHAT|nr:hypothetical protein H257_02135 [Aphanomyces astaci]ETV87152.1 hypothetical protein H257_02135 [Aphanomyces astaci]|eukprot:XP_009823951.1 hypothetical protein H257_02135 [Aphanomyces astaci]
MSHVMWTYDAENVATKNGKVKRIVRERYLRDDIACGITACSLCCHDDDDSLEEQPHRHGNDLNLSPQAAQYLLLTVDVVLRQMDVLEYSSCTELSNIIILETVAEQVKRKDMSIYRRLHALIKSDRHFYVFANEHHRDTYVAKTETESAVERDVRATCGAFQWYTSHLTTLGSKTAVTYIANDTVDAERAAANGVQATTISSFVAPLVKAYPDLADLMSNASTAPVSEGPAKKTTLYAEHKSMSEVLAGIKNKRFFQGTLRCNRDHWLECTVLIHGLNDARVPVLISGREFINRAMDGDVVAIEILPKAQWRRPADAFAVNNDKDDMEDSARTTEPQHIGVAAPTLSGDVADVSDLKPCGKVVGIVQRNWRRYCGSIEPVAAQTTATTNVLFVPVDRKIPKIRMITRQHDTLLDKRIVVAIDSWPVDSRFPLGHYVKTLGVIGDKETETQVLLLEHDIPCQQFSDKVLKCLPPADWTITPENSKGRTDLRHLPVCSIDPPNCKDIDDALHARLLPNGHIEVGVHIADVTHFVEAGSALDLEAADRGTSTYLVDKRLDMLPGFLTTQLCSLTSTDDHFAFSVLWELKIEGNEVHVIDVSFCKSIIRSIASLSYGEAQVLLDDPASGSSYLQASSATPSKADKKLTLGSGIKTLNDIAMRLKAKRIQAGALTLASPEVRFVLDTETQNPLDVQMYALKDTNALVEEFMLLANITVAKKILRTFPTFSLLRRHPAPSKRQFDAIVSQAQSVGVTLRVDNSKQLQESLDNPTASRAENAYFNKMLRILCTRCMMPASYFSSGEVGVDEYHHYGLAAPIYTHFTSPIRRYADVLVHRLLSAAIGVAPLPDYLENKAHLHELTQGLNRRHLAAQLAGRASVSLHTLLYFANFPTTTDAMINKVRANGIGVLLPRFGIEGMIFLADKGKEAAVVKHDPAHHKLTLLTTNRVLQVFQKVSVKVFVELTFGNRQQLKFELLDAGVETSDDNATTAPPAKKRPRNA